MISIFHEKLNEFMIIYIDNILVYSKTTKEHVEQLEYVLGKLQDNQLFAIGVKSEFAQEEMNFLKHILSCEGVKPNLKKLEAIQDWKRLVTVEGIWCFLRVTNFY